MSGEHRGGKAVLCADDYAISDGVSRGIRELIAAGRLTATSAIVTLPRWEQDASLIRPLRARASTGLHVNLTLGSPLAPMPSLAPEGRFPAIGKLTALACAGRLDRGEITAEIVRQLAAFIDALGFPPDHIDGHQHVHALPGVRRALVEALAQFPDLSATLIRDPADTASHILARGLEVPKALSVAALSAGFGRLVRGHGYLTNSGFSGFSAFDTGRDYITELDRALGSPGPLHMVMCHPGHADQELRELDPVVDRRPQELAALLADRALEDRIWRISRSAEDTGVDWSEMVAR